MKKRRKTVSAKPAIDMPDLPQSVGIVEKKQLKVFTASDALTLESGEQLAPVNVAYESYGRLNESKDNVILVCHALTGSAHAAGWHEGPEEEKTPGWWDSMIGPGKPLDTNRYYVVCPNFLGSCYGTTGPTSIDPKAGKPYGRNFPVITIEDITGLNNKRVKFNL